MVQQQVVTRLRTNFSTHNNSQLPTGTADIQDILYSIYIYILTTDKRCSSVGRPAELSHTLPLFVTFRIRNFNIWIEKIVCASRGSFVCYYISQMSTAERWRILPRLSPDNERSHISHLTTMWDCCFIPAGSSAGSPVFRQVRGEQVVRRI